MAPKKKSFEFQILDTFFLIKNYIHKVQSTSFRKGNKKKNLKISDSAEKDMLA